MIGGSICSNISRTLLFSYIILVLAHSAAGQSLTAGTVSGTSGLVSGAVPDFATALTFPADHQAQIGLFCGSTFATPTQAITTCNDTNRGALRVRIPADGTENDDHNPPRIEPRHLFDFSAGTDNLFRTEGKKVTLRFTVLNLTNKEALYNFQSTFSGTHFVSPRSFQGQIGLTF